MSSDNEKCACDEMELEVISLTDDNGDEQEFIVLESFEMEGSTYYVLLPPDEDEEAVILKLVLDENEEESLVDIEDDEEWAKAEALWNSLLDEYSNEEDLIDNEEDLIEDEEKLTGHEE